MSAVAREEKKDEGEEEEEEEEEGVQTDKEEGGGGRWGLGGVKETKLGRESESKGEGSGNIYWKHGQEERVKGN